MELKTYEMLVYVELARDETIHSAAMGTLTMLNQKMDLDSALLEMLTEEGWDGEPLRWDAIEYQEVLHLVRTLGHFGLKNTLTMVTRAAQSFGEEDEEDPDDEVDELLAEVREEYDSAIELLDPLQTTRSSMDPPAPPPTVMPPYEDTLSNGESADKTDQPPPQVRYWR